jgi:hypothetical protein
MEEALDAALEAAGAAGTEALRFWQACLLETPTWSAEPARAWPSFPELPKEPAEPLRACPSCSVPALHPRSCRLPGQPTVSVVEEAREVLQEEVEVSGHGVREEEVEVEEVQEVLEVLEEVRGEQVALQYVTERSRSALRIADVSGDTVPKPRLRFRPERLPPRHAGPWLGHASTPDEPSPQACINPRLPAISVGNEAPSYHKAMFSKASTRHDATKQRP